MATTKIASSVVHWLLLGVILVFIQVLIGGVTRLTDSGLSITDWEIIQGTLPPMNEAAWNTAFDLYKERAKKQYESLHADMTLQGFKVIYFWEYFHRLWARLMGLVFALPFLYFLRKKMIPSWLLGRLGIVIFLAALAAAFGWIMVASGLNNDQRTWVSAYKLIIHLGIATSLFAYLFQTWLLAKYHRPARRPREEWLFARQLGLLMVVLLFGQILLGGLMAGMRAGLVHPHFPVWVSSEAFFQALSRSAEVGEDIVNYEPSVFIKAWVQVFHRVGAMVLVLGMILFLYALQKIKSVGGLRTGKLLLITVLIIQYLLGILTIINSIGLIPITYGAMHQVVALILLANLLYTYFLINRVGVVKMESISN